MKKHTKRIVRAFSLLLAVVMLISPLALGMDANAADTSATVIKTGKTTASYLFVRSGAGSNYASVGGLWRGSPVDILEEKDGWYKIDTGWISSKHVKLDGATASGSSTTTPAPTPKEGNATVTASLLFIRKDPSTNYTAVGMLRKGDRIEVLENNGNWLKIDKGWVYAEYVAMDNGTSIYSEKKIAVVTANQLNVRKSPSVLSEKVGTLNKNQSVEVLETSGEWLRTNYGWINKNFVKLVDHVDPHNVGTVKALALNVRKGPGTGYEKVGTVRLGEKVTILENQGKWLRIETGWISADYVIVGK